MFLVPHSFCSNRAGKKRGAGAGSGGGGCWGGVFFWGGVHQSVLTKQKRSEQQQHHGGGGEHPGPLQGGGCRGDSAHPGCGQARGQELLLEGEVVHRHVVSQVWHGDGRSRRGWGDVLGEGREGLKVLEQTEPRKTKKCGKHVRYVCHPAQCPLAAVKIIKHFRERGEDFHLRRQDATSYCGKHVLNGTEEI